MSEPQLDQRQLESRKEIVIPITLKGLAKGYSKIMYDMPVNIFKGITRKLDDLSIHKRMRTGLLAVVTMPLGIMGRNGSRAAHNLADGKYLHSSEIIGGVGSAAAWWVAGKALFGTLATQSVFGIVGGKAAAAVVAAVAASPIIVPAFTVGTLLSAAAIGVGITALSTVPAIVNLKTGLLRTLDRIKGIKGVNYDDAAAEQEIVENSLSSRYERQAYREVQNNLYRLSDSSKKDLYENLKKEFDKAALQPANQNPAPQPVAQPAAAPASKKPTP